MQLYGLVLCTVKCVSWRWRSFSLFQTPTCVGSNQGSHTCIQSQPPKLSLGSVLIHYILPGCLEQYRDTKSSSCCRCIIYFATGGWCQWRRISPIRHQWCPCRSNSNKGMHYNGFSFHSQHPKHTPETIHLSIIICRLGSTTLSMQLPKKNLKWAQPSPSLLTDTAGYVG